MRFFDLESKDISDLNDAELREMVGRLCEAELIAQGIQPFCVLWGGAQEAADGGLDVHVKDAPKLSNPGFVRSENTGFQVKKNSMAKAACTKEMLYEGRVKPAIVDLAIKKGAYIIVSGKDDCSSNKMLPDRLSGMRKSVKNLSNKDDLLLDFYGRDRLATWLRQHPGVSLWVRSRLGKPLSGWKPYGRWAATPPDQDDEFLLDNHPCVIDTNTPEKEPMPIADGIKLIRNKLRNYGNAVRITGLSGVGKTRFVQALFETKVGEEALPSSNVIYADLGEDISPTATELVSYLSANNLTAFIVLDNCPDKVHRSLQKKITQESIRASLLTVEYDISDDQPDETEVIHLEPSSEEIVSKLVQKRFPALGTINADKIAEFAGGNARIAIALASRVDPDETLSNFSDNRLFERLFSQRKGISDSLLESAEILSLVYSFNVSPTEYNDELSVLASIAGVERRTLYRNHAELLRRQLSQQRGNWRAVLPHALANRLARRALENIPPDEINKELFKQENLRLYKSCAHRLSYLHDFEPARQLANSWIDTGCPLHDITLLNEDQVMVLCYITPVLPDKILILIEKASDNPDFTSGRNKQSSDFVRLLRQLAYYEKYFDRAVKIILKFAEAEHKSVNSISITDQLSSLFALYLSGTRATPKQRQNFLGQLLCSNNPRHLEIAEVIFQSAFETRHWSSIGYYDFGAHKRDYGWTPKIGEEKTWYVGFIELLKSKLSSENDNEKNWAKNLLARYFQSLWSSACCFDILEEIIYEHAAEGNWPEIWLSIKQTIYYDGKRHDSELFDKITMLENFTAPVDTLSEIKAFIFSDTWSHLELETSEADFSVQEENLKNKIKKLGEHAATKPEYLRELAPRLWKKHFDALGSFGEGLASGCNDPIAIFEILISMMQEQNLEEVQPVLFNGFIHAVYIKSPDMAHQLQERATAIPELRSHSVYLLTATKLDSWCVEKLIDLARSGEFEAMQFERISYGRLHITIPDTELAEMLSALNELKNGIFSTFQILVMRFLGSKDRGYIPSELLLSVGRKAIRKLVSINKDEISEHRQTGLKNVYAKCLSISAPENEIREIIELLCEDIESYRLYGFELGEMIQILIKNFPELILDILLSEKQKARTQHKFFESSLKYHELPLNLIPIDTMLKWCNSNQERILKVASTITPFSPAGDENDPFDHPKQVVLSEHIKALLEAAENPIEIVEMIYKEIDPSSWSGSRAGIMEIRLKAFEELLEHPSHEVCDYVKNKLPLVDKSISEAREWEAKKDIRREQTFE